ncbi:MAG: aromatic compound degradation protein PaaI [Acidocella sp. 20-57-95]|nr:MAG: aromatic compound degradation protein PaaI [Acidocella sp. 20-57-95]HQT64967.1 PaaI family thioesterase [Acidocella sp.]HQU04231.1 PaaI family thioesterase [Acidocella sp.]
MSSRSRTFTWEDPKASALKGQTMSGLDYLKAMSTGELPPPPIFHLLGIATMIANEGLVTMELPIGEYHYNPIGSVHGGVAATILDSVMGCAVHSLLPVGRAYSTLEIKINYLRPMTEALGTVIAEGRVINAGRKAAFAEGKLVDARGKIYATGSTTCAIWDI